MIIEAAVVAMVVAGGSYLARRLLKRRGTPPEPAPEAPGGARPQQAAPGGLEVGDVLLYLGDELWLAGSAELDEEGFVMRVFRCPGGREATHVVQLDRDARELVLAKEAREVPAGPLPGELRLGGARYALRKRGSARVLARGERVLGASAPCRHAVFGAAGGGVLVVIDPEGGERLALVGSSVPREMIEILPGSAGTQPDPPG